MAKSPSLLIFGSQTPWPSESQLDAVRSLILSREELEPLRDAIEELADFNTELVQSGVVPAKTRDEEVTRFYNKWLQGSPLRTASTPPPNSLVTSLTVLVHITQYLSFILHQDTPLTHDELLRSTSTCGIQGFCTGLLSSLAVSASASLRQVGELSMKCFRLAFALGRVVDLDAEENADGPASCVAVRWNGEEGRQAFESILATFPAAYVSVIADASCVSVTLPTSHAEALRQGLQKARISARAIETHGRYHSISNRISAERLKEFCSENEAVQLPKSGALQVPVLSNFDSRTLSGDDVPLHDVAIDSILVQQSRWFDTFAAAIAGDKTPHPSIALAGYIDPVPSSISRSKSMQVTSLTTYHVAPATDTDAASKNSPYAYHDDAVAIVGMSCKLPGCDSLAEYFSLIKSGSTVLDEVEESRFTSKGLRRTADGSVPFHGSFVRDADAFDHEFFKKSPREAASMDPKQRMLLEEAYHAMETTGQWTIGDTVGEDIGCYIGVATDDYYDNVNSHKPNAFTATGTLRAFLAGKVSHFFGWTGPAITLDTACSGSLVAVHTACNAIRNGECSRAIAGGVNSISSPHMHQNLNAATFLSKTGLCKPFDEKADGYCRGEGTGLVSTFRFLQQSVYLTENRSS